MELYKVNETYKHIFNDDVELEHKHADEFKEQALNISAYIKNIESDILVMKEYEKDIKEKRKRKENKINKLKEYVKETMQHLNIKKISGIESSISIQKSPERVEIIDDELVPSDFKRYVQHIDKSKILQYLKDTGELVDGINVVKDYSLRIK